MEQIYIERLKQLADHLECGKLGHEIFDITAYNSGKKPEVGRRGDAVGELPVLFPEEWRFTQEGLPILSGVPDGVCDIVFKIRDLVDECLESFFGIDRWAIEHLFDNDSQHIETFGGRELTRDATPQEVAFNIREYLKLMTKEQDNEQ